MKRYEVRVEMIANGRYRQWTDGPYPFRWVACVVSWLRTIDWPHLYMRSRVVELP